MREGGERKEKSNEGAEHAAATEPTPRGHAGKPRRSQASAFLTAQHRQELTPTLGYRGRGNVGVTPGHKGKGLPDNHYF